ncbi:MAG: UDP-2,3-diacylglucosamine diphosphatase LpxI [Elusimicrobia bacterium]|nr:UDP-2,3-diacylglucosamine diphosphatase LpxI [Elusimicrobiota bacterium]
MNPAPTETLGLIAGFGRFPQLLAEEARRKGRRIVAVGFEGETEPDLERFVDRLYWFRLGQFQKTLNALHQEGARQVVLAGRVSHSSLYKKIRPDWRAVRFLATLRDKRADTILKALMEEFRREGLEVLPSSAYLADCIPSPGRLTRRSPTSAEQEDIQFGLSIAKGIAGLDIGQTVVVKEKAVIAVEAMEGTDACILRAAQVLCDLRSNGRKKGPLTVVKVAKSRQDMRFDLPTVGPITLESMSRAGATALALESKKTILLDRARLIRCADETGISIVAL